MRILSPKCQNVPRFQGNQKKLVVKSKKVFARCTVKLQVFTKLYTWWGSILRYSQFKIPVFKCAAKFVRHISTKVDLPKMRAKNSLPSAVNLDLWGLVRVRKLKY